jgi:14-3-3 protein epsilon
MQLLRDNLTLWTSSDSGEAEPAAQGEAAKKEEEEPKPAAEEGKADAPAAS